MNLKQLENEALHLPEQERARLVQKLVLSLDTPYPEELEADWLSEAQRRSKGLDEGSVQAVPAEEVMRKARHLLK
nr:addiction module protein [uncultured Halomonas sp.]